jgi:hypothetical protein
MKERPIIFSAESVRAILEGRKTQTRRVLKGSTEFNGPYNPNYLRIHQHEDGWKRICPLGVIGDRLWVRESHRLLACACSETCRVKEHVFYEADQSGYEGASMERLRSPIHMPRWASRLTLEITDVRVQHLQDITEADSIAEGMHKFKLPVGDVYGFDPRGTPGACVGDSAVDAFSLAWDHFNVKHAPWASNPLIWAITFRKVSK